MWDLLQNIIGRLIMAIIAGVIWNFFVFIINFGLYRIKKEELPNNYNDMFWKISISNCIMIFICFLLLWKENILLLD